jgi:hypothetical protein
VRKRPAEISAQVRNNKKPCTDNEGLLLYSNSVLLKCFLYIRQLLVCVEGVWLELHAFCAHHWIEVGSHHDGDLLCIAATFHSWRPCFPSVT